MRLYTGAAWTLQESALKVDYEREKKERKLASRGARTRVSIATGFSAIPAPAVTKKMVGNQLM